MKKMDTSLKRIRYINALNSGKLQNLSWMDAVTNGDRKTEFN